MEEVKFDQADIDQNRNIVLLTAILQIFFGILFFIPLVACKDSPYAKFYANQGLLLFLLPIAAGIVAIIPILGWIVAAVVGIARLVFAIMNAVNASKGLRKGIPLVGQIEIIK